MDLRGIMESKFPGYNCQQCGFATCDELAKSNEPETKCIFNVDKKRPANELTGTIDGLKADFRLGPIWDEPSCREDILPLVPVDASDIYIKYRPIGCPIAHFGKILKFENGILTIHLVGPRHPVKYKELGRCMVIGFEGIVTDGKVPNVCDTVVFIPEGCMMQKCHSGAVVHVEGKRLKIEGIDLKVWNK
jgi:hypothetical protein